MPKLSTRHLTRVMALSLGLTLVVNGEPASADEVGQALAAVDAGSVAGMKSRLINQPYTVPGPEDYAKAMGALPDAILNYRITQGRLLRRVEIVLGQVIQLHGRSEKYRIELFFYHDNAPSAGLWKGCVMAISDGLVNSLLDDELLGVIAHELGHTYFMDEMVAARRTNDTRTMRVVELKCDAVAILSLKLLGRDPTIYMRGLRRMQAVTQSIGLSRSVSQTHPELVKRAQFARRFVNSLG